MKTLIRWKILRHIAKRYFLPRGKQDETYQENLLRYFVVQNIHTLRGQKHQFSAIRTISDFQARVPLVTYDDIQPHIESMMQGAKNVLWYGRVPFFSKSSWTMAMSKYIPITHEALKKNHYAVSKHGVGMYLEHREDSMLFAGEGLIMGGRLLPNPFNPAYTNVGDVSAILQYNAPWYTKAFRKPSQQVSFMENFDAKLDAMIQETKDRNITYIAWVPSWLTLFLQRLVEQTWKKNIYEIWPNLELFFWWGINVAPYAQQLARLLPWDQTRYRQNYNASEWFFAVQDRPWVDDMLLATHHHVFYEFIPFDEIHSDNPKVLLVQDVEKGKRYEMAITTDGGLRRYRIGDVVEVTNVNPVRIRVAWRTKSFLNAFGEEVMGHTTDAAIRFVCEQCNVQLADYVATPVVEDVGGYHEWFIDIGQNSAIDSEHFASLLDSYLQENNSDYKAKRSGNILMKKLQVRFIPAMAFHRYLETKWKLWGQHKLKKLWNNREELMKEMGEFILL